MSGNNNNHGGRGGRGDGSGGGGGRGRGRRRPRNNSNNNRDHSPNRRRRNNNEHSSINNSIHDNTNSSRSPSSQRRNQSPNHARNQRNHQHNQQNQNKKKITIHEPEPQISSTKLAQILADPIPPLIISFDVENASGTWLGEIWQIGAVASSAAAAAAAAAVSCTLEQQQESSSSSFLVNIMPVGNIHWGVTKHCTNVRINQDQRTGRRCLWHTIRKQELTPSCNDPATGLESFLNWIESQRHLYYKHYGKQPFPATAATVVDSVITDEQQQPQHLLPAVILMAHGNLDASNLLNNLAAYGLLSPRFESLVAGFVDSQRYLRNSLTAISDRLFPNEMFHAHNALADAQILFHAVHVKKPPPPQQQHGGYGAAPLCLLPADRLALVEPLQETFIATLDAIALTKYKVSKLAQKLPQPPQQQQQQKNDTVRSITALLCVDNVSQLDVKNVIFVDQDKREQQRGGSPPPVVFLLDELSSQMNTNNNIGTSTSIDVISYGSNNTTMIAFDVQFTESTGVRSHIHRICAMEVFFCCNEKEITNNNNNNSDNSSLLFDMTCVPPDEVHQVWTSSSSSFILRIPSDAKSHTTREILEQFLTWLADVKKKNNNNHIVLCAYGPRQRKWPGLLNHMSYHGLESNFASIVVGVCDLALAMANIAQCPAPSPAVPAGTEAAAAASSSFSTSNNNRNNSSNNTVAKYTSEFKSQDKAHISFCVNVKNGVPPVLHRANEVCQSNHEIAKEIITRRRQQSAIDNANNIHNSGVGLDLLLPLLSSTITYRSAYANAQVLLDQSLGADIMAGVQFDNYDGEAYKAHRLPRLPRKR